LSERPQPYAFYALALLTLANFSNYVDRSIVSILGQRIKTDLHLDDAQLGFLLGTAFAVFYGVLGISMGRIADVLSRTRLMAVGLVLWSGMTALGAFARGFGGLAAARLGVGVGEATANPCSHSLISGYFPARNRATALATYLLGTPLGSAFALVGGGLVLQHWRQMCGALPGGACRLADWRAALLLMGLPGLLLAILLFLLPEPNDRPRRTVSAARVAADELSAGVPPFTLLALYRVGGRAAAGRNLLLALVLAGAAVALSLAVGDWPQWAAVALGAYSVVSWAGVVRRRDPPLHALTFGCPTFRYIIAGAAVMACVTGAVQAWSATYVIRALHASPQAAGLALGPTAAVTAGASVLIGGFVADIWKRHDRRAPVFILLIALVAPAPAFVMMLAAKDLAQFTTAYGVFLLLAMLVPGPIAGLIQDLVLPSMRGAAAAGAALIQILVASGVGPYWVGKISTLTGSLSIGLFSVLALAPVSAVLLILGARGLGKETFEERFRRVERLEPGRPQSHEPGAVTSVL
jgi:MFS family permease